METIYIHYIYASMHYLINMNILSANAIDNNNIIMALNTQTHTRTHAHTHSQTLPILTLFHSFISALCSNSNSTTSARPLKLASISAVQPS